MGLRYAIIGSGSLGTANSQVTTNRINAKKTIQICDVVTFDGHISENMSTTKIYWETINLPLCREDDAVRQARLSTDSARKE